jgi:hypothetical protein
VGVAVEGRLRGGVLRVLPVVVVRLVAVLLLLLVNGGGCGAGRAGDAGAWAGWCWCCEQLPNRHAAEGGGGVRRRWGDAGDAFFSRHHAMG